MPSVLAYIAPLALLWPLATVSEEPRAALLPEGATATGQVDEGDPSLGWMIIDSLVAPPVQRQVRIEQRVTIRISPVTNSPHMSMMPSAPSVTLDDLEERDAGKCVALRSIRGIQSTGRNRLVLYMRDRRLFSLRLEKPCRAQDFYSGFYVEPRTDGMLCVERDTLRSRTGASCELAEINRLVLDQ